MTMERQIKHYLSSRKNNRLHQAICRCKGHGFRYHILGIGRIGKAKN